MREDEEFEVERKRAVMERKRAVMARERAVMARKQAETELALSEAFAARYAAPVALKERVMLARAARRKRVVWMERVAAAVLIVMSLSGAAYWRHEVEMERQRHAAEQLMIALRVTSLALDNVGEQVSE